VVFVVFSSLSGSESLLLLVVVVVVVGVTVCFFVGFFFGACLPFPEADEFTNRVVLFLGRAVEVALAEEVVSEEEAFASLAAALF
jgi:hypothetical protein